ncbi:hypothetical protein Ahy_A04g021284 [Arachis hypogaea]|uniref:Retroviral polymerase SH3-like domain-containing protein n=1 Tax=Arachis hypogaea TaxID=3818 RepID=A0A445DJV8_ARAHY|nr:hypothetical protein Ahy_A04g021284 [Arachis hypogaea]
MARTMLNEANIPKYFWADAVSTACYVMNRIIIRPILKKTPYELYKGRKPNISHLHVFGCKCFILNNGKDNLGKFDAKADEGIFLGYSLTSKAFRVYNKRIMTMEESIHVAFDETNRYCARKDFDENVENFDSLNLNGEDKEKDLNEASTSSTKDSVQVEEIEPSQAQINALPKDWRTSKDHPLDNVIGDVSKGVFSG